MAIKIIILLIALKSKKQIIVLINIHQVQYRIIKIKKRKK